VVRAQARELRQLCKRYLLRSVLLDIVDQDALLPRGQTSPNPGYNNDGAAIWAH